MRPVYFLGLAVVGAGAFLAGRFVRPAEAPQAVAGARRILYYHDPMHPAYKSDKPGIAPDCGMQLEPVYGGGEPFGGSTSSVGVQLNPERQQLIGLHTSVVEKTAESANLRLLGRVVVDDARLYRVTSATDGWVRSVSDLAAGDLIKKNERLASFYGPEFLSAIQTYLFALNALDRYQKNPKESASQISLTKASIQVATNSLKNLGMGEPQLEQFRNKPEMTTDIGIYSPVDGIILMRNLYPSQRFDKGTELYRIADLSRVWILADLFQNDAQYIRASQPALVRCVGRTFRARTSRALPLFDPATRTQRVRLEVDNPAYVLRPEMFVDVEFPMPMPAVIAVPIDAVIDSGRRKIVYVDGGNGAFEPRTIETGRRFGDRIAIASGLKEGERIVVAGTFLVDSESRMKLAAQGGSQVRFPFPLGTRQE